MSRARRLIEALTSSTETAPPPTKKPGTAVPRPIAPPPGKPSHSPFRRKDIKPDDEPRPKAYAMFEEEHNDRKCPKCRKSHWQKSGHAYEDKRGPYKLHVCTGCGFEKEVRSDNGQKHFSEGKSGSFRSGTTAKPPGRAKKLLTGKGSGKHKAQSGLTAKKAFGR